MRLEGTHQFAAPRAAVWEALMDPTVLAQALPGGEQMERVGDNEYRAVMNVKVGPVQGRFEGKIQLSDIAPLDRYTMKVDGQGAPGFVAGEGVLELADHDGGTLLRYGGDVNVGGRIAGVGQRLIESTARSVTRQGLSALDQMIQARLSPTPAAPGGEVVATNGAATGSPESAEAASAAARAPAPAPPTADQPAGQPSVQASMGSVAGQVVKDVARDLLADYVPPDKQERVVFFGLGALAMLLFVVLVRLVQKD